MLAALDADRTRVADIEAQILDLERSLSVLRNEKALVQERLDTYKYPVLTLPNEIISEIFIHFLPTYPLCPPLIGIFSPSLLTHICRRWREIALGTPALWRAIHIPYTEVPLERQLHILDLWMTRSRSCPLSIQIERGVNEVMAAVVSHCARFEHLKLSESSSDLVTIEIPMPLLRHLDLRMRNQIATVGTFRHVPLLRTVTLNHFAAVNVALPWAQLTSLTLNWVFPHEFFPILQQTLNLVHCELKVGGAHRDQSKPDTRLLRLESLTLNNFTGDVEGYLDAFLVPALLNLEISEPFLCANPIDSLALFISKSGCKLQKMHITDTKIITSGSYRQAFPSIQFFFDPQVEGESDSLDVASDSNSH